MQYTGPFDWYLFHLYNHVSNLIISFYQHRDDVEDQELELAQIMEGMPTTMGGFKDHPM
jgi:xeroderma pigmentosum group C-complementing protein